MPQEDFKRLSQNYQGYLRDFYFGKTEQLMKSVEFIVHKGKFIKYLSESMQELQHHSKRIEQILTDNMSVVKENILERVIRDGLGIPHAVLQLHENAEPGIRENVMDKWNSLKNWFIDSQGNECECKKVLRITNNIIKSIIQNAALIVQFQNGGTSGRDDYHKFLELFLKCEDLEEAQKLSAHVFGVQKIRHFEISEPRRGGGVNENIYKDEPTVFLLKPHTRSYREKRNRRGFTDKSLEKYIQREKYLQKIRRQKEIVVHYVRADKTTFSEIEEIISEETGITFLQQITQANMNSRETGRTEYGQEYRLTRSKGRCVLKCEDGDLVMPAFILGFKTL